VINGCFKKKREKEGGKGGLGRREQWLQRPSLGRIQRTGNCSSNAEGRLMVGFKKERTGGRERGKFGQGIETGNWAGLWEPRLT